MRCASNIYVHFPPQKNKKNVVYVRQKGLNCCACAAETVQNLAVGKK